ncbi:MAG: aquaporin [Bacteroidota bacterium]
MKAFLTELIGTFFLVLTIGLTVVGGSTFAPLAIGSVLMVLVYMGGHVSGAHYNPAVTVGLWLSGNHETKDIAPYIIAQLLGAIVAAFVVQFILGGTLEVAPNAETSLAGFFLLELLFTFILMLVILNVAVAKQVDGNSFYGLAIGFTVLAGAFAAGPVSGGAFNPAVAIGPILVDAIVGDGSTVGGLWVYLVATFLGAAAAVPVFKIQERESDEATRAN